MKAGRGLSGPPPPPPPPGAHQYPAYQFGYAVDDPVTQNHQSRQETRDGDRVTGSYSYVDPTGSLIKVTYEADAVHGYRAHVETQPGVVPIRPENDYTSGSAQAIRGRGGVGIGPQYQQPPLVVAPPQQQRPFFPAAGHNSPSLASSFGPIYRSGTDRRTSRKITDEHHVGSNTENSLFSATGDNRKDDNGAGLDGRRQDEVLIKKKIRK